MLQLWALAGATVSSSSSATKAFARVDSVFRVLGLGFGFRADFG